MLARKLVLRRCVFTLDLITPYKLSVLFVGHIPDQRHKTRCLIRVSTICLQNVLLKFELK